MNVAGVASSSYDRRGSLKQFTTESEAAVMRLCFSKSETLNLNLCQEKSGKPNRVSDEVLPPVEEFKYHQVGTTGEGRVEQENTSVIVSLADRG